MMIKLEFVYSERYGINLPSIIYRKDIKYETSTI